MVIIKPENGTLIGFSNFARKRIFIWNEIIEKLFMRLILPWVHSIVKYVHEAIRMNNNKYSFWQNKIHHIFETCFAHTEIFLSKMSNEIPIERNKLLKKRGKSSIEIQFQINCVFNLLLSSVLKRKLLIGSVGVNSFLLQAFWNWKSGWFVVKSELDYR